MSLIRRHLSRRAPSWALLGLRVCAVALLLCASTPVSRAATSEHEPLPYGLERVLLELEGISAPTPARLLDTLVVAGPRALPELREALREGEAISSAEARAQYARALSGIPALVAGLVDPTTEASRLDLARTSLALDILRGTPRDGAAEEALALVRPGLPGAAPQAGLLRSFERTLTEILTARPAELEALADLPEETYPSLRLAIVRAAGAAPSTESASFLAEVMDTDPSLDRMVLAELGRVLEAIDEPCDPWVELRVLSHLDSQEPSMRREACMTAGRVELFDAVPRLIELLEDPDEGARESAAWALERITAMRMKPEPERWLAWHRAELEWWSHDAREAFSQLRSSEAHEVAAAIRALSGHRNFRHQISEELCVVLKREEGSLAAQACAALGALGSARAIPELVEALSSPSEGTRTAAGSALERITGRTGLPAERDAWVTAGFGVDNPANR